VAAEVYEHWPHAAADSLSKLVAMTSISHRKQRVSLTYFSHVSHFSSLIYDVLGFPVCFLICFLFIVTCMGAMEDEIWIGNLIYLSLRVQTLVIAIHYKNSQYTFSRILLQ
jgi:ABC-type multidrug transport system permease subunit